MWPPRKNFEIDVRPPCEAYFLNSTSQWKAKAAAQAVNNFAEWCFLYFKQHEPAKLFGAKSAGDYRTFHANACREFRIVWDLAEAAKHRRLTKQLKQRIVTTSTGGWAETQSTLKIISTGDEVDVLIGVAMKYWENQI